MNRKTLAAGAPAILAASAVTTASKPAARPSHATPAPADAAASDQGDHVGGLVLVASIVVASDNCVSF